VIFSQWERMTRLIAKEMDAKCIGYEYLHGGVPSKARKDLVDNFTNDPDSRVFLSTDAGSTGLNLQAASIVINMDLPWNPAVHEQRIARIYRLGQQKNIQVINIVSANTFEEEMLGKLRFKTSLFEGVLDGGEDTIFATDSKFKKMMEELNDTMNSRPDTPSEEQPIDKSDEEMTVAREPHADSDMEDESLRTETDETMPADGKRETPASLPTESDTVGHTTGRANARKLMEQGVSFISGLAETLKSPEATKELMDSLIEENKETGETHIRIPVPDRETVARLLNAIGSLFTSAGK